MNKRIFLVVKLISHLHFPEFYVYVDPIIKSLRKVLSTVLLGLSNFLESSQADARVILLKAQKCKWSKFKTDDIHIVQISISALVFSFCRHLKKMKMLPSTHILSLQIKMGFHHVTWSIYKQSLIFLEFAFLF